jgi:hypothetical protein
MGPATILNGSPRQLALGALMTEGAVSTSMAATR